MSDNANAKINHPTHYNQHPSGIEAKVLCEQQNFNLGNAWKYLFRAGKKEGEALDTDLRKARWYLIAETRRVGTEVRFLSERSASVYMDIVRAVVRAEPNSVLGQVLESAYGLSVRPWFDHEAAVAMLHAFDHTTHYRFNPDGPPGNYIGSVEPYAPPPADP